MKKNLCANCGGKLKAKKIEYEKKMGEKRAIFDDVPAHVCSECHEVWIDGKVLEKIESIFLKGTKPKKWLKVPVWSFSHAI